MRKTSLLFLGPGVAIALLLVGCLPGDTRPPPAVVHLTVEPSAGVTEGVTTVDGWKISFEKLLLGIGDAGLRARGIGGRNMDDSACNGYSDAGYERLFDVTVPGQQKLSDLFGLGTCGVRIRLRTPGSDALLGAGVNAQDLAFMRVEEADVNGAVAPRSVYVRGKASRGAVTKRFEWSFRTSFTLHGCTGPGDMGFASDVVLANDRVLALPVVIRGEELFRDRLNDEGALRFDAIAAADADGDQAITLEELAKVAAPEPAPDTDGGPAAADGGAPSFADFLAQGLSPRMIRLGDSGACVADPL